MALFGQLTKPAKELPLIDVSNPDIVMELLEELAITVSTSEWIKANEPYHPEAADIHDQAQDVYSDLLGIFQGKVRDKRVNRKVHWAGDPLREHLSRHEVEVEGGAGLVEQVGDGRRGDGETGADAGEAVGLREGAHDDDVTPLAHVLHRVGLVVGEVDVGLVDGDDDVVGHLRHEVIELLLVHHRAQWVGRVGDEDEARLGRDGAQHAHEVVRPVGLVLDLDVLGAEEFAHNGVHREAVAGGDEGQTLMQEGVAEQLDDLAAAAAHDGLLEAHAEVGRDAAAQIEARAVGVDMSTGGSALHGLHRLGRGPERIFVGCQLHDVCGVHPQLAGGLFNGLAGLVGDQVQNIGVRVRSNAHDAQHYIPPREKLKS